MKLKMNTNKVKWSVTQDSDGYIRVFHSQRGQICVAVLDAMGRVSDITFDNERNRKCNPIRMPAMAALRRWEMNRS